MALSKHEKARLFVVISYCRCGTHMLRSALDEHPEICCWGEIFEDQAFSRRKWSRKVGVYEHIRNAVLAEESSRVGFCIQGYPKGTHLFRTWPRIWKKLAEIPKVIRLHRHDLFARAVSHWYLNRGRAAHVWSDADMRKVKRFPSCKISVDWLREDFKRTLRHRREIDAKFPLALHVFYEDFVQDMTGAMANLQRFLGVERIIDLLPGCRKPSLTMRRQVRNYDEIKEAFRGTSHERFFTE